MKKLFSLFVVAALVFSFIALQAVADVGQLGAAQNPNAEITQDFYTIKNLADGDAIGYSDGLFDIRTANHQYFYIVKVGDYYKFRDMTKRAITAQWDGIKDNVTLVPDITAPNQLWKIDQSPHGFYIQYVPTKQFIAEDGGKMVFSNVPSEFSIIKRVAYTGKTFTYYSMVDNAWAARAYSDRTMAGAGCGPTSLAMIINYYSKEMVTPLTVADISVANNLDILASPKTDMPKLAPLIAEKFGVNYKQITKSSIISELKSGNTVLIMTTTNKAIHYTLGRGHYLVLRGLDKNGWIIVNDPLAVHSYHTQADSSVENYWCGFNYVAPEDALLANVKESYSFWNKEY